MGRFKAQLEHLGYNTKERVYVYGGAIAGAVAPIVGARYLLFNGMPQDTWVGEAIAWGGALLLNASSIFVSPHLPVPVYTGGVGAIIGTLVAQNSKRKRIDKERDLETMVKKESK